MTKKLSEIQKDFRKAYALDVKARKAKRLQKAERRILKTAQAQHLADRLEPSQIPDFLARQGQIDRSLAATLKPPKLSIGQKLKALKGFTSLPYKQTSGLKPKNKAKIHKAFKQFWHMKSLGYEFSKIKSKRRKDIVKGFYKAKYDTKLFKGAFFPNPIAGTKGKLVWNGKQFKIKIPKTKTIPERQVIPIDHRRALLEGKPYIDSLIKKFKKTTIFAPVTRNVGPLTKFGYSQDKTFIGDLIAEWETEYKDTELWLDGIIVVNQ